MHMRMHMHTVGYRTYACICMRGDPMGGASGGFTKQNERFRPELLILSSKSGGCIHAYVCMHIHAYACICACICIHMHAYACVEIPWGAQVVVLLSKMKGSDLNCRFYQASSLLSSALVLVDSMEHSQKWQCVLLPAGEVSSGLSAKLEGSSLKPSWLAWAKDSKMLAQHFLNSVVASTWAMVP